MTDMRQWIADLGLGDLPEDAKTDLITHIVAELEIRVGTRLAAELSTAQLAEFEELMKARNQAAAVEWLGRNVPNHRAVLAGELDRLSVEVRERADDIREAAGGPDD